MRSYHGDFSLYDYRKEDLITGDILLWTKK